MVIFTDLFSDLFFFNILAKTPGFRYAENYILFYISLTLFFHRQRISIPPFHSVRRSFEPPMLSWRENDRFYATYTGERLGFPIPNISTTVMNRRFVNDYYVTLMICCTDIESILFSLNRDRQGEGEHR